MIQSVVDRGDSNNTDRLLQLQNEMDELIDKTNNTYNAIKQWMSAFSSQDLTSLSGLVKTTLQIPLTNHSDLSAQENFRLHALLQFSNFALYLKKLENETAFYNNRLIIQELQSNIVKASCTLRSLLQPDMSANIMIYAVQDLVKHIIPPMRTDTLRRVVCCIAVNIMLDAFKRTEVSVAQSSVRIVYDEM